ncbi:DNA photolyase, FAD-binding/Cryptochrome, partial [Ochromonadaceae sp. CCMP2298]
KRTIVLFRNDLRVRDNAVLNFVASSQRTGATELLCVYCFDPRTYRPTQRSLHKTGVYRAKFLLQSVENLRQNLRAMGCELLVATEKPEELIPKLLAGVVSSDVVVLAEATSEEQGVETRVQRGVEGLGAKGAHKLHRIIGGHTLYHPEDIPYELNCAKVPNMFTPFKEKVEGASKVRPLIATPTLPTSVTAATLSPHLGFTPQEVQAAGGAEGKGVMAFQGGEDAALGRLQQWMFRDDNLKDYFEMRNGMLGEAYSSKLSPWLAAGCISPRQIYHAAKRYESERGIANKSTYWLVFELIWRDFFRFFCIKHGKRVFMEGGACSVSKPWNTDEEKIRRWKLGQTGQPLVDANMRELLQTGFMSNRGRQNVASYLVLELGVDWRVGADHFESLLLDSDTCSNWGNWNAAAGLTGGRVNRFNCVKQSRDYDPQGTYIKQWLPELARLPLPMLFNPSGMSASEQSSLGVSVGV